MQPKAAYAMRSVCVACVTWVLQAMCYQTVNDTLTCPELSSASCAHTCAARKPLKLSAWRACDSHDHTYNCLHACVISIQRVRHAKVARHSWRSRIASKRMPQQSNPGPTKDSNHVEVQDDGGAWTKVHGQPSSLPQAAGAWLKLGCAGYFVQWSQHHNMGLTKDTCAL
jgi:hypothetical protein